MFNNNYEEEKDFDFSQDILNPRLKYLNQSANELYNKDRRYFPKTNYKNLESNISTLSIPYYLRAQQRLERNSLLNKNKSQRFQNENSTVYRVSPFHYQYISRINNNDNNNYQMKENYSIDKENGDQSYNLERERQFRNYNQFLNSKTINRHQNYLERNLIYNRNSIDYNNRYYNDINTYNNIKNQNSNDLIPKENINNEYTSNNNNKYSYSGNDQVFKRNYVSKNDRTLYDRNNSRGNNNKFTMRRSNSDFSFIYNKNNNRYNENDRYGNQTEQRYVGNSYNDYDARNRFKKRANYYNPKKGDYKSSRFGDYTYNYYLNSPMRGDISEDWRFPPIYCYRQNIRNNLYPSSNDINDYKNNFFNENF